jgi:predicted nucleotide-binding protein
MSTTQMNTEIDWSQLKPETELGDLPKNLIREIADGFLRGGLGTPDQEKRIELGKDRHVLDRLVQAGYIRNVSNKYYPTFTALFFVRPELRSLRLTAIEGVLHALKYLYRQRRFERYTLRDIQTASDVISRPMMYEAVRIGAQFLRDFPIYSSNLDGSPDEPVSAVHLVENILDFENLAQAWEDEMRRRHPDPTPSMISEIPALRSPGVSKKVFVVHGRDERLRAGMFTFLHAVGLEPIEWIKAIQLTGKGSPHIADILNAAFEHAQAVVVLLTPDDEARLRKDLLSTSDRAEEKSLMGQARPNVLFEAGMAFASHENQTVLVQFGSVRPFSDIAGRHVVRMDGSGPKRHELAMKLKATGCSVDLDGSDWQTLGDLTPPVLDQIAPPSAASATQPNSSVASALESKSGGAARVIIAPVSRSTSDAEYSREKVDEFGTLIRLPNGVQVRIPKPDYIESWDDVQNKPKLILTRKYFQGYFPGHENAVEYFLPR